MKNFYESLQEGKVGEKMVEQYLLSTGWSVEDTSKDKEYQDKDIDFIVKKGRMEIPIEVKYDSVINYTENFFIEVISCVRIDSLGWFHKTHAEYIWYIDKEEDIAYVFKTKDMEDYIENNFTQRRKCTDGSKTSVGIIVNIHKYKEQFELREIKLGKYKGGM